MNPTVLTSGVPTELWMRWIACSISAEGKFPPVELASVLWVRGAARHLSGFAV